jgi:CPA2 family monovalent cation:H+ antiporter-2
MEELSLLTSMAAVLGVALIAGMAVRRLGLPVILGYLLGGIVIGPFGLQLVKDVQEVETLATIGVALLMFTLGIEFSLKTLKFVGRVAVVGGIAQIVATMALGVLVGWLLGWPFREAIQFGFFISLSSTIVVLKTLMERGELGSAHGRVMIGILLVQDLSVVPMMVIIPSLDESGIALLGALGWGVLKAGGFLAGILVLGFWVLPWLMRRVAEMRSRELFLLAVVCLCLGAAFGAYKFGLSIALGAFVAGLIVSESDYGHQALADIRPLRDMFAVLFFVSLGMLIDPAFVSEHPGEVAAVVAAVVLGKFVITSLVARAFGYSDKTVLFVGSGLFQIGEFSFVLAALALNMDLVSDHVYSLTLTAAVITILLTPFAMNTASVFYNRIVQSERGSRLMAARTDSEPLEDFTPFVNHVVVCGYGRVSTNLGKILDRRKFSYLVIDIDPRVIDSLRERGVPCIYGDASNPEILARAELGRCRVLVVTFPDPIATRLTVENARRINPRLDVVARIHTDEDIEILKSLGVAELVRPEMEAGLEIIRHTLHRFGLSGQEILFIINTLRDETVGEVR